VNGVAFTVFGGDYDRGAAVLLHSLGRAGWQGRLHVAYVDARPPWAPPLAADWQPWPGLHVVVEPLPEPWPLCRWRVAMAQHLAPTVPAGEVLAYFDADIVVKGQAAELVDWAQGFFACVEDVFGEVPVDHPQRRAWAARLANWGYAEVRPLDRYVNSGFFAWRPGTGDGGDAIVATWADLLDRAERAGVGLDRIKRRGEPQPEWHIVDQDLFNAALMATTAPLALGHPRAMDFGIEGDTMAHPVLTAKPWRRRYLRDVLRGRGPTSADHAYWAQVAGPAAPFGVARRIVSRLDLKLAAWVGRMVGGRRET